MLQQLAALAALNLCTTSARGAVFTGRNASIGSAVTKTNESKECTSAHLADSAAFLVAIVVEGEHALGAHKVHALLSIWKSVLYSNAIMLLHGIKQLVSLRIQSASVKTTEETKIHPSLLIICPHLERVQCYACC